MTPEKSHHGFSHQVGTTLRKRSVGHEGTEGSLFPPLATKRVPAIKH